jgi:hypothetical protein
MSNEPEVKGGKTDIKSLIITIVVILGFAFLLYLASKN